MSARRITAVDLFCGAGGTTEGLSRACASLGLRMDLLAINHWPIAISSHTANHPDVRHICWPVDQVKPRKVLPHVKLDLLCASPECTHHSVARGGMPVSDQRRAGAWEVCRWATEMRPSDILVENVREFESWGPIGSNGRPLKSRRGETFRAWVKALESLNYRVEHRVLNCADYGDPTSRKRLFVRARRGRGRIEWPEPSHGAGRDHAWRTAREIIDWQLRGSSIFNRPRPLAPRTLDRIAAGLRKFGGAAAEPFLVMLYGTNDARSIHRPAPTVTANGQHVGLCQPFLLHSDYSGPAHKRVRSIDRPLDTVTTFGSTGIIEPFIVAYHNGHGDAQDGDRRTHSLEQPLPTVDCSNRFGVCQPFVLPPEGVYRGNAPRSVDAPLQTVLASRGGGALIEPFLVNYNGQGKAHSTGKPCPTVTTHDRFGLVEPAQLDILFRMLEPHELARAQGFDTGYTFLGSKSDQVKQIGNAVPPGTAAALCEAILAA